MRVELIATGDELLNGSLTDANNAFLADRLFRLGIEPWRMSVIGDNLDVIVETLRTACERSDFVVMCGGLGPTADDLTAGAVARLLGVDLVRNQEALDRMTHIFAALGFALTPNNEKQADLPRGADVFQNQAGTAPAFAVRHARARLFCLPGVPVEFRRFVDDDVLPEIRVAHGAAGGPRIVYQCLKTIGMGESHVETALQDVVRAHPHVRFGYRAHFPELWVKMLANGANEAEAQVRLAACEAAVRGVLGPIVFGTTDDELPAVVGGLLRERGLRLAFAESCTGGLASVLMTDTPGSSAYFAGAAVAYANEVKELALGVDASLFEQHGAVSPEVAAAMAEGARENFGVDLAVAITGIAGPDGGTAEKPVGLVHFALAHEGGVFRYYRKFRGGRRDFVRRAAAFTAIEMVRRHLLGTLEGMWDRRFPGGERR